MRRFFPNLSNQKYSQLGLEIAAAKRSLYFLWWRYLRLSEDYWWLCQQKGRTLDKEFAETYKLFGDVFADDFGGWWQKRGSEVFSYTVDPPRVEFIKVKELMYVPQLRWIQPVMVPLHLTKSEILSQMNELLKFHEPVSLPKSITTEYEVEDLRGVKKKALIDSHRVWCLSDAIIRAKAMGSIERPERLTQYWIGKQLGLDPKPNSGKRVKETVERNERLAMRVKVNRYQSKAINLIANVELGKFPVMTAVEKRERWSKKQLADKAHAIGAGQWVCPESDDKEFKVLLPFKKSRQSKDVIQEDITVTKQNS